MPRFVMVIDLKKCIGCNACVVACKSEHNVPNDIFLTVVLEKEEGQFPAASRVFLPVLCNHCGHPVCVDVCPTKATYQREDGIVLIDWDKCIGCKACIVACPYDSRSWVKDNRIVFPDGETTFENPVAPKVQKYVPIKCDFCVHRVDNGLVPACVEVCPVGARMFGDIEASDLVAELVARGYARRLLDDKGTEPYVYYVG